MNQTSSRLPKPIIVTLMTIWSVVMTALLAFFGGSVLRGLKTFAGSRVYWMAGTLATVVLIASGQSSLSIAFACMFLIVGTYSELEDMELIQILWSIWMTPNQTRK